jgi:hypothetical protein
MIKDKKSKIITFDKGLDDTITGDKGILKSIKLCFEKKMYLSTLILTYTGIDTMAYLSLPENKTENKGEDFIKWVEKYMKFYDGNSYPGNDLWASRCGILHFMSPQSKLVKNKKARQVVYGWGDKMIEEVTLKSNKISVLINIEPMVNAFENGVYECLKDLYADLQKEKTLNERIKKTYKYFEFKS